MPDRDRRSSASSLLALAVPLVATLAACPGKHPCQTASDCPARANQVASCNSGGCDYAPATACNSDSDCPKGDTCQTNPSGNGSVCLPAPACQNDVACATAHVCRNALCTQIPCGTSIECELGEECKNGFCDLAGCRTNADCTGSEKCDVATNACVQCLSDADCPPTSPTCHASRCASCLSNADCGNGKPPYCQTTLGQCVYCVSDQDCAPGLVCSSTDNVCHGVAPGGTCAQFPSQGITGCSTSTDCTAPAYPDCVYGTCGKYLTCDVGGLCVQFSTGTSSSYQCMEQCNPYDPQCPIGQGCGLLQSGPNTIAFVFGKPLGGCLTQPAGASGLGQTCGGNAFCLYGLECIPASAAGGICRQLCDLAAVAACDGGNCAGCDADAGEACNPVFVGYNAGENIGVCYPPSDLYKLCLSDADCGPGFGCSVAKVPPGPPYDPEYDGYGDRCAFAPGSKTGLTPCTSNTDCTSGICIDRGSPPAGMYCYGACGSDADCTNGVCETWQFALGAAPNQVTLQVNGCRGKPCTSDSDCAATSPLATCDAEPDPLNPNSSLVLRCEPPAGTQAPGSACTQNSECTTDTCFSANVDGGTAQICWGPCIPGGPATCPAGTTCVANAVTFQALDGTLISEPGCVP